MIPAALFGQLNAVCYRTLESSIVLCKLRGNPQVELAHWLHQLLHVPDCDLLRLLHAYDIEPACLLRDVTDALDRLPRGTGPVTVLSPQVGEAIERAGVQCVLFSGAARVRSVHLLAGLLASHDLRRSLLDLSMQFGRIDGHDLMERHAVLLGTSPEREIAGGQAGIG